MIDIVLDLHIPQDFLMFRVSLRLASHKALSKIPGI